MKKRFNLNQDYISKKFLFFRIPEYKFTFKEIFHFTVLETKKFAKSYYLRMHNPQTLESDLPIEGQCSELNNELIEKFMEMIFSKNVNYGFFEFYLFNKSIKEDSVFAWSLGDFIYLDLDEDQFLQVKKGIIKHKLPEDLYINEIYSL